jgi:hypothetical protein
VTTKRPRCKTPGCGRAIPKGGEGVPEVCPHCIVQEQLTEGRRAATMREIAADQRVRDANSRSEAAERLVYSLLHAKYGARSGDSR